MIGAVERDHHVGTDLRHMRLHGGIVGKDRLVEHDRVERRKILDRFGSEIGAEFEQVYAAQKSFASNKRIIRAANKDGNTIARLDGLISKGTVENLVAASTSQRA